jgi:hypothetical protein
MRDAKIMPLHDDASGMERLVARETRLARRVGQSAAAA